MFQIRKWYAEKFDEAFAYHTVKLVRVRDGRIGVIHLFFKAILLAYVVFYVGGISKKYLEQEKVQGFVLVKVMKPQFSQDGVPWDVYDRVVNPGERGATFIPTRIVITKGQTQGEAYCESPLHGCKTNEDCNIHNPKLQKAECVNEHCMRRQWCPAEDDAAATSETHYLEFDKVELWFHTYMYFHRFRLEMSTSDEEISVLYPDPRANTYRLRDLVEWANLEPADIMENGAVMEVNLNLDSPVSLGERTVKQVAEAHAIDTATGFNFVHNEYYHEDGVRKRDSYRFFGIRVLAFATGYAERVSLSGIILQFSSALALWGWSESLTDAFLLYCVAERKHYAKYRTKETEDFNEEREPLRIG